MEVSEELLCEVVRIIAVSIMGAPFGCEGAINNESVECLEDTVKILRAGGGFVPREAEVILADIPGYICPIARAS